MSKGIIYVAIGAKYVAEARISALSAKQQMPHVQITIFTDQAGADAPFDQVIPVKSCGDGFKDKVIFFAQSPYEQTLFLDTDTYIADDITELFDLLDHFDLALAHDNLTRQVYDLPGIPACFPEYNTAVVACQRTSATETLFAQWLRLYDQDKLVHGSTMTRFHDQPSFRLAAYQSEVRIATLTPEYNCMFRYAGAVSGKVKVVHGRLGYTWFNAENLEGVARNLNTTTEARVFYLGKVYVFQRIRKQIRNFYRRWSTYEMAFAGQMFQPDWQRTLNRMVRSAVSGRGFRRIRSRLREREKAPEVVLSD